jgi:hypothetical protein
MREALDFNIVRFLIPVKKKIVNPKEINYLCKSHFLNKIE